MLRRWPIIITTAVALASGPALPSQATGVTGVYAGACVVTVTVTFGPGLGMLPAAEGAGFSTVGTCVVNGSVVSIRFSGTLATNPFTQGFGCVSGVISGSGSFYVPVAGFPIVTVEVTATNTAGAITMAITNVPTFAGVAELAQDPFATAACALGTPIVTTTWTGALVFQDPTVTP